MASPYEKFDTEPADMICAEGTLDPLQVAIHLHEEIAALDALDGRPRAIEHWHALPVAEQVVALAIAEALVHRLLDPWRDEETDAEWLHDVRYLIGGVPAWSGLTDEERALARLIIAGLLDRFRLEGTLS